MGRPLNLTVGLPGGTNIAEAFGAASDLCRELQIAWVEFKHNDVDCVAYPDGRGFGMTGASTCCTWSTGDGFRWTDPRRGKPTHVPD